MQGRLAEMGGNKGADAGLLKEDVDMLLVERSDALAEKMQEVDDLEMKNKELQAKVN